MATLTIPDATYELLARQAEALGTTPDALATARLESPPAPATPVPPLTGDAWQAEFEAMIAAAKARADRYPPGFTVDDSRETIYQEREKAQR